jgi:hypothetical protein
MLISFDRPSTIAWSIDSTNHNASILTSADYLVDGKVSIPCRFTFDVGAQSISNFVTFTGTFPAFSVPAGAFVYFAVLMPKTPYAVPQFAGIDCTVTNGTRTTSGGAFVALTNSNAGIMICRGQNTGADYVATSCTMKVKNLAGVSTWAASGQTVDVGEFWFGTVQEFKGAVDPKISLLGGPTERRSHSNSPWPLMQKPYRQFSSPIMPIDDAAAYGGSDSLSSVLYALTSARSVLVIPRLYQRGSTTAIDTEALNQLAIFGRPAVSGIGPLTGVQNASGYWTGSLVVEESPP